MRLKVQIEMPTLNGYVVERVWPDARSDWDEAMDWRSLMRGLYRDLRAFVLAVDIECPEHGWEAGATRCDECQLPSCSTELDAGYAATDRVICADCLSDWNDSQADDCWHCSGCRRCLCVGVDDSI